MKNLFLNIGEFLKTLTLIDYILYIAILVLIVLVVSLIYLLKTTDIENDILSGDDEEFDIKNAVKELEEKPPRELELTDYEKEQEANAIISYDELVSNARNNKINYAAEEKHDDVLVKKFDLDNLVSEEEEPKMTVRVVTYEHEEAFLAALKQLQKLLD